MNTLPFFTFLSRALVTVLVYFFCWVSGGLEAVASTPHGDTVHSDVAPADTFIWAVDAHPVTYALSQSVSPAVQTAIEMWRGDMQQVMGQQPITGSAADATVRIVQLDRGGTSLRRLRKEGIPVDSLQCTAEAFAIRVVAGRQLLVVGSDARGTAYGVLELSRMAGVSPWVWWGDVNPMHRSSLAVPIHFSSYQHPSVAYRGIFLNDEDWSLQPWSWRTFAPTAKAGLIDVATYREIFKLLLRLRANMIWPGMHGMTTPFYCVAGAKEAADSCGIVIGTSHCEPLMRNNVGEWSVKDRGRYNYMTNREAVQSYWIERLREVAKYENFYTVGMRGIHDGSMEGVKTLREKTDALQQVIDDQRGLLARYVNKRVDRIPQVFVPYKEVLQILENGLRVPDDVTLMWCDDNYGYMTRLSDTVQQRRSGGAGVYYHLSYWGRPHDYMWLCTTQPGLIYSEMKQAYDHHARRLWIVNVHDLKPAAYDLELFLDMAWNIHSVSPSSLCQHQEQWLCRDYGDEAGRRLLPLMLAYYRQCAIRKPEFMGWNQVELDKAKYSRGWSPVVDTQFSQTAFGGELDRYLSDYAAITRGIVEVEACIPAERRDAFFAQIKYPVLSAANMSVKMLEAQRARAIASGSYDAARWRRDEALLTACAKSQEAYQNIRRLTAYYNDTLAAGRWRHSMCDHPRDLYVFNAPTLPVALTDAEVRQYLPTTNHKSTSRSSIKIDSCVARNACDFTTADAGAVPIQTLGHSMNAVSLPKGATLTYDFDCSWAGEAVLRTALIPTQPNDKGDLRICVSIDGDATQTISFREPFRSEQWKQNVLRGQAVGLTPHVLAVGRHRLTITALDDHVIIDQWMLDFKPLRSFYVFPLAAAPLGI